MNLKQLKSKLRRQKLEKARLITMLNGDIKITKFRIKELEKEFKDSERRMSKRWEFQRTQQSIAVPLYF